MTGHPASSVGGRRLPFRTILFRVLTALAVFVLTAAPLPGDTPGCTAPGSSGAYDDTPALIGDGPIRMLCSEHCMADCRVLVDCGVRYTGPTAQSQCQTECTIARGCPARTFDAFCPESRFGPGRVVTEQEYATCVDQAGDFSLVGCWCDVGEDCWAPTMSMPFECTDSGLCDPRE
jgi:hypothetical protein